MTTAVGVCSPGLASTSNHWVFIRLQPAPYGSRVSCIGYLRIEF